MNNNEKLSLFINNPKYRKKVLEKERKKHDNEYNKEIKKLTSEYNSLIDQKKNCIKKIVTDRLNEGYANGALLVNSTEGKIYVNRNLYLFSSIKSTNLNFIQGSRIVTNESTNLKKNASVGGAVIGGIIGGKVGATIGGSNLGKSSIKTTSETNQIMTCSHLGILIQLDDKVDEIVLINQTVDQDSKYFLSKQLEAQNIITRLNSLSKTPVPTNYVPVENEIEVLQFDDLINDKKTELNFLKENKPLFFIPNCYRASNLSNLSDDEYLDYLNKKDIERKASLDQQSKENFKKSKIIYFLKFNKSILWIN